MKRYFFPYISLLFIFNKVNSQATAPPDLAKIVRPSPAAGQIEKYGDYPIDYNTGLPQISVPLYTINSSRLSLPISISYHGSGFKPRDPNGVVGNGWTLNAGGRISRTVAGKADEMTPSPWPLKIANQLDVNVLADRDYLHLLDNPATVTTKDNEYDIFNYSVGSLNGKFLLKNVAANQRVPVTLPFKPIKITSNSNLSFNSSIDYFQIVSEDGTIYRFGKSLIDATNAFEITTPDVHNAGNNVTHRPSHGQIGKVLQFCGSS